MSECALCYRYCYRYNCFFLSYARRVFVTLLPPLAPVCCLFGRVESAVPQRLSLSRKTSNMERRRHILGFLAMYIPSATIADTQTQLSLLVHCTAVFPTPKLELPAQLSKAAALDHNSAA